MQIFWINIDKLNYRDFLEKISPPPNPLPSKEGEKGDQNIVFTPNPEILLQTKSDSEFKKLLEKADYLTPDGIWLYIAFQILDNRYWKLINTLLLPYYFFNLFFKRKSLYRKYGDRICWSDITKDVLARAIENNTRITIIDLYNPTDLKKVESQKIFSGKLKEKFPKLHFDYFIYEEKEKNKILEQIKKSDSKIIFSTLGMKKQEESVIEIMDSCKNIKLWLGIGSSFDYFIGFQKIAPKIWRQLWLEWLYRLITGPRKITRLKRLYSAIFVFTYEVIREK